MTHLFPLIRVPTPRKGLMTDERKELLPGAYIVGGKRRHLMQSFAILLKVS